MGPSTPTEVVNQYLSSFYSGDFTRAAATLAADFSLEGPLLRVDGRDAYLDGAQRLRPVVRGHLLRQWHDDAEVCSIYRVYLHTPAGSGSVVMSEWHTVRNGRVIKANVVFDTAPFRALMPAW
jgi:hypothetical protein